MKTAQHSTAQHSTAQHSTAQHSTYNSHAGFTLVELSIVLIIIGLIVAGVTGGMSLKHAFELRSVITDINKFKTAIHIFEDKYDGLPGDITNATQYWTAVTNDGDGDQKIEWNGPVEDRKVWQELSLAGMIEGSYDGTNGSYKLGVQLPPSKIDEGGYWLLVGDGSLTGRNIIRFAKIGSYYLNVDILTPADALWIDQKADDGGVRSGDVGFGSFAGGSNNGCTQHGTSTGWKWVVNVENNTPSCYMWFFID